MTRRRLPRGSGRVRERWLFWMIAFLAVARSFQSSRGEPVFGTLAVDKHEPYLEIHESGKVRYAALGDDPLTIGRHGDNRVVLGDTMASRFHCLISKTPEGFIVRDLNSSNGTAVNGKRTRYTKLSPGDAVTIGSTRLVLLLGNGQVPPPSQPAPSTRPAEAPRPQRATPPVEPAAQPDAMPLADLSEIEIPEPVTDEEIAEPLTEDDVVSDDAGAEDFGTIPLASGGEVQDEQVVPELASARDPAEVVESLAESLPEKPFGETDIALVSARGQMVHPAGGPAPRGNREAVDWFRLLLLLCSRSRATDIHFEPKGGDYILRMRIDATMIEVCHISNALGVRLLALVKVLSEVDISIKNAVQEGHFSSRVPAGRRGETRRVDYRVSFAPSVFGQKLVIRVLDTSYAPLHVRSLQLPDWMRTEVERAIKQDAGMVLVCGPTGSGKTTTLYALLRGSDIAHRNVMTIEDPVEIQIEGVTQIPVDEAQDKTFSSLLRSALRQDPDVILIGEIRDAETARIAMQAAITGHLVFSTLHTQNTIGTIFRLLDLGVEPYLISQALHLVLAQRLVRQLCPYCKLAVKPTPEQLERMGPAAKGVERLYAPRGCGRCLHTGFFGRRAIFELLTATDTLRDLITHSPSAAQMKTALASTQFQRLHHSGYQLVVEGIVPFEEIDRAVGRDSR